MQAPPIRNLRAPEGCAEGQGTWRDSSAPPWRLPRDPSPLPGVKGWGRVGHALPGG